MPQKFQANTDRKEVSRAATKIQTTKYGKPIYFERGVNKVINVLAATTVYAKGMLYKGYYLRKGVLDFRYLRS